MKYLIYSLLLLFSVNLNAQGLDEEVGFLYTKAKYLLETNRIEDAVKELNKLISKDGKFEDALLLRAEAKYALGAYSGVKKDLAKYIESNGITERVARLYGLTDFQAGNKKAALNSLNIALKFIKDDKQIYEVRAQILEENGDITEACADYRAAAKLGSTKADRKAKQICTSVQTKKKRRKVLESPKPTRKKDSPVIDEKPTSNTNDEPVIDNEEKEEELESETSQDDNDELDEELEEETEKEYVDDTPREIVVDEDLTLIIMGEGLGTREITNQPNILIISDDSGEVAINVCVSKGGRITTAEYDNANSTIRKQSLISLAIRKAKDFWFVKGDKEEQCGKIVFKISGS